MAPLTGNAPAHALREHGFWDYTTPGAGSMEQYGRDDYRILFDDMAVAGMNSLVIVVKWFTTGYKSALPFLDQQPDNPVIASNTVWIGNIPRKSRSFLKIAPITCFSGWATKCLCRQ